MLRWLYLDLNSYFASVEQQLDPALRGRPIAVGPEAVGSGTIIAASIEAKRMGVKTGMKVADARRLCPQIRIIGGDHGRYVAFHERIVAEVGRHVPVTHVCSIDEVACRLLDNEASPEAAVALAGRVKAGIARRVGACLTASIGLAPSRLLAKMAADMEKPDGLTVLTEARLPEAVAGLPLSDIPGIGRRMEAKLGARGLVRIGDLLALSPAEASRAFGSVMGARLWWQLSGVDLPEAPAKSKSVGHSHVLAPSLRTPEAARLTARRLLLKAAARLRRLGTLTGRLTLSARLEGLAPGGVRTPWDCECRLAATDDSFELLAVLEREAWPRLAAHLGATGLRVQTIGVSLDASAVLEGARQYSLFDPAPRRRGQVMAAMDALNARFGRNAVTLGPQVSGRVNLIGAKIAFNRIPERAEFHE